MKSILNLTLVPGFIGAGVFSAIALPTQPASADLLRDAGIGAATNVVTGEVLNNGNILNNAIGGAATGAAVGATHSDNGVLGVVQDAAVGAAANVVTGLILNNGGIGDNAVSGAATGAVVGVTQD